MPGPVSDSYDPEFGTGENAATVAEAVEQVRDKISQEIGSEALLDIVAVCESVGGPQRPIPFNERQLRIIRFAMNRALESL